MASTHHSSVVMLVLLILFAVIHSGGAALRSRAEAVIGARAWRLIFAAASIPSAVVVIGWFLAHRYDGVRLWNLQGVPGVILAGGPGSPRFQKFPRVFRGGRSAVHPRPAADPARDCQ